MLEYYVQRLLVIRYTHIRRTQFNRTSIHPCKRSIRTYNVRLLMYLITRVIQVWVLKKTTYIIKIKYITHRVEKLQFNVYLMRAYNSG